MQKIPYFQVGDGDKVFVFTTMSDESLGSDGFYPAFENERDLIDYCKFQNEKYLGQACREITIFEVHVKRVRRVEISEQDPGPPADYPRD